MIEEEREEQQPETADTPEAPEAPQAKGEDELLAGMDSVLDELTPKAADEPQQPAGATGAEPPAGATGATGAAEPTPEQKAAAEQKAKDDAEIKSLGLKEKAAERFRHLNERARIADQLEKEIEPIREQAAQAQRFNEIVADTGASAQQIAAAFKYLKGLNSGEREQMRASFKSMLEEVQWLAKELGEPFGGVDLLADHPDLKQRVEADELTQDAALELVRARAREKSDKTQNEQRQAQERESRQLQEAAESALAEINTFGAKAKQIDPHFAHKIEVLKANGTIELIKETAHPSKWAEAVRKAYERIPNPAPKPAVQTMQLRPTGGASTTMRAKPKNALEAAEMGLDSIGAQHER